MAANAGQRNSTTPYSEITALDQFREALRAFKSGQRQVFAYGLTGLWGNLVVAALGEAIQSPTLVITRTARVAQAIAADLETIVGDHYQVDRKPYHVYEKPRKRVAVFPASEMLPYQVAAASKELTFERIEVLDGLRRGDITHVVAPISALLPGIPPLDEYVQAPFDLRPGQGIDIDELLKRLVSLGYEPVERVEGSGQFSRRGGIVDIYSPGAGHPWRLEFFGDEIEDMRTFAPGSQRSIDRVEVGRVLPARATVFTRRSRREALDRLRASFAGQIRALTAAGKKQAARELQERVGADIDRLESETLGTALDLYAPFVYPRLAWLMDYFPTPPLVVVDEPMRMREAAEDRSEGWALTFKQSLEHGRLLPEQAALMRDYDEFVLRLKGERVLLMSTLLRQVPGFKPDAIVSFPGREAQSFFGKMEQVSAEFRRWVENGFTVITVASSNERKSRVREVARDAGVPFSDIGAFTLTSPMMAETGAGAPAVYSGPHPGSQTPQQPGKVLLSEGDLSGGIEILPLKLVILTDQELFGQVKKRRRVKRSRDGISLESYHDLEQGDYVVHVSHGIGVYQGIQTLEVDGVHRDYLHVAYAGDDALYVPTEQIDLIQKYVGSEGRPPKVFRLGGNEWQRALSKVRRSVREMAKELIQLYAARETISGVAFPGDTPWERQFADAFFYQETPDQVSAIEEIRQDMEEAKPMDRLLCGDVGYGKTEVAMRAAFKAVVADKQVAVLVPTTILAQQHENTFKERFAGFPVRIEMISRFKSQKEQQEILKGLAQGKVDIVIGTHRLLQKEISFKDLGLLIIDEEQRFGVAHKERIKQIKKNVDVLTLTATPIPRTLHMALAGLRDVSLIETPPEDRFPVQTYVAELDRNLIRDAIFREIDRGGQVYYVHNRVSTIDSVAQRLSKLVPEASIAVGHGQMPEERLEAVMLDFLAGEYDILVSTTIIESGLDITNVNTLVVEDSDRLGLAQLYQLRGRVGRSNRVAYAYFTYRPNKVLSEVAEKRLRAIKEFTELGSGFKLALRDLEIRGAGNLLGAEQHGHITAVGFDLYMKMLDQAIKEGKVGAKHEQTPEIIPSVEISVDAYISEAYITDPAQKIEMYKKIVEARDYEELEGIAAELQDRFGPVPPEIERLLAVAEVRQAAAAVGIGSIRQRKNEEDWLDEIVFQFAPNAPGDSDLRKQFAMAYTKTTKYSPARAGSFVLQGRWAKDSLLPEVRRFLYSYRGFISH